MVRKKTMVCNLGIRTHYKVSLGYTEIVGLCGQTAANRYFTQPNMQLRTLHFAIKVIFRFASFLAHF